MTTITRFYRTVAVASIAVVAATTACSTGSAPGASQSNKPISKGPLAAGAGKGLNFKYLSAPVADPDYNSVWCGVSAEAKRLGTTAHHQESQEFSASSQIPTLNAAAAGKPNGLLVTPTDPVGLQAPLRSTVKQGVPVVTVVNQLKDPKNVNAEVTVDNESAGRQGADYFAKKAGKKKVTVASFGFTAGGSLASDGEIKGFKEELKKYPNIKYAGTQYVGSDAGASTTAMNSVLAREKHLFGVYTAFGDSALGVLASLRQRKSKTQIVAGYAATTDGVVKAMKKGKVSAIIYFPFKKVGATALDDIVKVAKGQRPQPSQQFPAVTYTRASFKDPAQAANLGAEKCPA